MELFFDTETSDRFNFKTQRYTDSDFPWVVQLGAILAEDSVPYIEFNAIIAPDGRTITEGAAAVHNIPIELADRVGLPEELVMKIFIGLASKAEILVAHNYQFDSRLIGAMLHRNGEKKLARKLVLSDNYCCTMEVSTELCRLPGPYGWKWPKLSELYKFLFNQQMIGAHDAMYDIRATMKCYYELKKRGYIE